MAKANELNVGDMVAIRGRYGEYRVDAVDVYDYTAWVSGENQMEQHGIDIDQLIVLQEEDYMAVAG